MITKYNKYNESIKDKMTPKSTKESIFIFSKLDKENKRTMIWNEYMDLYFNRGNEFKPILLDMYDRFGVSTEDKDPTLSDLLKYLTDDELDTVFKELLTYDN